MFRPFGDESFLGFFDQEIILIFHFPTSCIFRLRGALISIPNHQIRETRWLAKQYVWFNLRKVLFRSLGKCYYRVESNVDGSISPKKVLRIRQISCKVD